MRWVRLLDGSPPPAREVVGGKAWSLARMRALGLPVPPAFVVTTEACHAYFDGGRRSPEGLDEEIAAGVAFLERESGRRFGDAERPLLVSVRSGAAVSMPGMMDTILDLGMNDIAERALAAETGDAAFADDTHRRFCELFARIVLKSGAASGDSAGAIRAAVAKETGEVIPEDPREQLRRAVAAVFESSRSRRARSYRKHHGIPEDVGTAVTIQAMVFGNLDERSGTGVLFTRNPSTGEPVPWGEWLGRAQGEDVVSGTKTPLPLAALRALLPEAHAALLDGARILEREERDAQDVEFTVERGRLWFLQTRAAKRSPEAAVRIAVDLASAGVISRDEALARVTIEQVETLLRPQLRAETRATATVLGRGEPASPGIAQGIAIDDCDEAERRAEAGEAVVLARPTTSPEDVHGMIAARAVVTELGGATSHAAVVGRQLAKPCVVGCGEGLVARIVGREVTIDGGTGEIFAGRLPLEIPDEHDHPELAHLSEWAGGRPLAEALARRGADGAH